ARGLHPRRRRRRGLACEARASASRARRDDLRAGTSATRAGRGGGADAGRAGVRAAAVRPARRERCAFDPCRGAGHRRVFVALRRAGAPRSYASGAHGGGPRPGAVPALRSCASLCPPPARRGARSPRHPGAGQRRSIRRGARARGALPRRPAEQSLSSRGGRDLGFDSVTELRSGGQMGGVGGTFMKGRLVVIGLAAFAAACDARTIQLDEGDAGVQGSVPGTSEVPPGTAEKIVTCGDAPQMSATLGYGYRAMRPAECDAPQGSTAPVHSAADVAALLPGLWYDCDQKSFGIDLVGDNVQAMQLTSDGRYVAYGLDESSSLVPLASASIGAGTQSAGGSPGPYPGATGTD